MKQHTAAEHDVLRVTLLKGIAIVAVVIIHTLSSIKGDIFTESNHSSWFIFLDQFCRMSVPLFIGLSGYALTKRYYRGLSILPFFWKRVIRLLPIFLIWTLGLWVLFMLVPAWDSNSITEPLWQVILLGRGDYHLYFVPLIFQFYLLFPWLLSLLKRHPQSLLIASVAVQLCSFGFFGLLHQTHATFLGSDQAQYSLLTSWITYFVFGMWLAEHSLLQRHSTNWLWLGVATWLCSLGFLTIQAQSHIWHGADPIDALKFTRFGVVPYALSSIFLAVKVAWERMPLPLTWMKAWKWVGEWSFVIFLSHTLVLRLLFDWDLPGVTTEKLLLGLVVLCSGLGLSYLVEQRR